MDLAGIKDRLLLVRKILLYKKYVPPELPMNQKREVWTKNNLVMFAELVEYRVSFYLLLLFRKPLKFLLKFYIAGLDPQKQMSPNAIHAKKTQNGIKIIKKL